VIDKGVIRREMRAKLKALSPEERLDKSRAICRALMDSEKWNGVEKLGVFSGCSDEPELSAFLGWAKERGIGLYFPRYRKEDDRYEMVGIDDLGCGFVEGRYGIPEPSPLLPAATSKECADELNYLVPGLAFDRSGNRLGRGRGYYDRLLAPASGRKTGVFFQFQELDAVPGEPNDRRLDAAVTEKGWIIFKN